MDNPGIYPTYLHHREILFFFASAKPEKITEMIIEGLMAIQAGESPSLIERKLNAYCLDAVTSGKEKE